MSFINEYLKKLYESNNKSFLNAIISDNVETFIYDLLIIEFGQSWGSNTRQLAKELYKEEVQPYIATLKLFNPLLK
jgi:hypothetical protein